MQLGNNETGHRDLACAILTEAIRNWRAAGHLSLEDYESGAPLPHGAITAMNIANALGFETPREELIRFFESDWCITLLQSLDIDVDEFYRQLNKEEEM